VLSAAVLLVSWIFLESSVLLTQVFFKMPFYGILWACTHVLCGSPTVSSAFECWFSPEAAIGVMPKDFEPNAQERWSLTLLGTGRSHGRPCPDIG